MSAFPSTAETKEKSTCLPISANDIIMLLGDPDFYRQNPMYLFMDEQGLNRHKLYLAELRLPAAKQAVDPLRIMQPAIDMFIRQTAKAGGKASGELQRLRRFLYAKCRPNVDYDKLFYSLAYTDEAGNVRTMMF